MFNVRGGYSHGKNGIAQGNNQRPDSVTAFEKKKVEPVWTVYIRYTATPARTAGQKEKRDQPVVGLFSLQ